MTETTPSTGSPRLPQRVRHPLKLRRLEVRHVTPLGAHMTRVTFAGADLHGFVSASFDDHVKLMLPAAPGAPLVLPELGPDGPRLPAGATPPVMRDYTPRRFDAAAGELDIEFVLHGDGPAAAWAAQAAPGQPVGIGGPRGSMVIPLDYDWHLLIGDESALPAIARRLEELPATTQALVLIETGDGAEVPALTSSARVQVQRLAHAGSGDDSALVAATRALQLPAGEGYAWAAGEARSIAAVRKVLVEQHGMDKGHIRAAAYWKHGAVAHHENLQD